MNKIEVLENLNIFASRFNLEKKDIKVIASSALVLLDIIPEAGDIDINIPKEVFDNLPEDEFEIKIGGFGPLKANGTFDIGCIEFDCKYLDIEGYMIQDPKAVFELKKRYIEFLDMKCLEYKDLFDKLEIEFKDRKQYLQELLDKIQECNNSLKSTIKTLNQKREKYYESMRAYNKWLRK